MLRQMTEAMRGGFKPVPGVPGLGNSTLTVDQSGRVLQLSGRPFP